MEECRVLDRQEMIKRPRKKKTGGPRKFPLCPKWDPRAPNVREGLKLMEEVLYYNKENEKVFPKGSIIAGFKRQRNLGEIISPSKPVRTAPPQEEKGCFPCAAPRACTLHQSGVLQQVQFVTSRFDGTRHYIHQRLDCSTQNVVYYIFCDCQHAADYVGSTKNMKDRWSKHKSDIREGRWTKCGLNAYFGQYHMGDMEEAMHGLRVTLVDSVRKENDLKRREDSWMCNLGTLFVGLHLRNKVLSHTRLNYGGNRGVGR